MKIKETELRNSKEYKSLVELMCAIKLIATHVCPDLDSIAVTLPNYMVMPFMTGIDCEWAYVDYNPDLYDEHYIIVDSDMNLSCEPAHKGDFHCGRDYIYTESVINFVHEDCNAEILDSDENIIVFSIAKK